MKLKISRRGKQLILVLSDVMGALLSAVLAFLLINKYVNMLDTFYYVETLIYTAVFIVTAYFRHAYSKINRYFGIREVGDILLCNVAAFAVATIAGFILFDDLSLRFLFLVLFFASIFTTATRMGWRLYQEEILSRKSTRRPVKADRVLLVGAGEGGNIFVERFRNQTYNIVGFVDSDKEKQNTYLAQIPVIGTPEDIPSIVEE